MRATTHRNLPTVVLPAKVVKDFYAGVWRASELFIKSELEEKYIGSLPSCTGLASENGITFMQMSGLFTVVGAVTGATLLSGLVTMLVRIYHNMDDREEQEPSMSPRKASFASLRGRKTMSRKSVGVALSKVFSSSPSASGGSALHSMRQGSSASMSSSFRKASRRSWSRGVRDDGTHNADPSSRRRSVTLLLNGVQEPMQLRDDAAAELEEAVSFKPAPHTAALNPKLLGVEQTTCLTRTAGGSLPEVAPDAAALAPQRSEIELQEPREITEGPRLASPSGVQLHVPEE